MNTIHPEGGQQDEAIEVGLWYINQVHAVENITQVILIGDREANTVEMMNLKKA